MPKYYQDTETQMTTLVDYSALSEQSLATLREYMDYQGRETLVDVINTQTGCREIMGLLWTDKTKPL